MQDKPNFYLRYGKRLLDISFAIFGLLLLTPLLALIVVGLKSSSSGPVFFGQERIGRRGGAFTMWKFRSMIVGAQNMGSSITAAGDLRITRIGHFLRLWKLDELPQLWNVLIGDMSMVGPRPELPIYVKDYSVEQRNVLSVRPGITDPASIRFRNEEELLAEASDRDNLYREIILPSKLNLSLQYVHDVSFTYDLLVILRTIKAIMVKTSAPKGQLTA